MVFELSKNDYSELMLELTTTSMVVGFDFVEAWPLLMKMLRIEKRIMILLLSGLRRGGGGRHQSGVTLVT